MELYVQVRRQKSSQGAGDDGNVDYDFDWYFIDDDTRDGHFFPIHGMSQKLSSKSPMCTCLGSTICIFESINNTAMTATRNWTSTLKPTDPVPFDFWYMDVDMYEEDYGAIVSRNSWIRSPSTLVGLPEGIVIAGKGKIFVFSDRKSRLEDWGRIYDVESRNWSVLMPPQDLLVYGPPLVGGAVVLQDMDSDVLLLYFPQLYCLYSYNIAIQEWDIFDSDFGDSWGPLTLCGPSILLAMNINLDTMSGYHLGRKKWLPVAGLHDHLVLPPQNVLRYEHPSYRIISVGNNGEMCLLWSTHNNIDSEMNITCTKFMLREREGGYALDATVGYTKQFTIEHIDDWICCLALDPPRGSKRGRESSEGEEQQKEMKT